jgi:hypothetical protein
MVVVFLWIGAALGAVVGVIHGLWVFRRQSASGGPVGALYFALWTLVLWIVFGAYVLAFWILGASGLVVSRVAKRTEAQR